MKAQTINAELSEIIKRLVDAHTYGSKMVLYAQIRKLVQINTRELWEVHSNKVLIEVESVDDYLRSTGFTHEAAAKALGISRGNLASCVGDSECKYHAIVGGVFMKGKYNPDGRHFDDKST